MCSIMTISRKMYDREAMLQMWDDSMDNPHGYALVLVDRGGAQTVLRTMSFTTVVAVLEDEGWDRMFLHCRWATQGETALQNTHGWEVDGVFYMHNGCLMNPRAKGFPVDSMLIGEWIQDGGLDFALEMLEDETFANVFMIDNMSGHYVVSRSSSGSLFTDGYGNYSTNPVGEVNVEVEPGTVEFFPLVGEHDMPEREVS